MSYPDTRVVLRAGVYGAEPCDFDIPGTLPDSAPCGDSTPCAGAATPTVAGVARASRARRWASSARRTGARRARSARTATEWVVRSGFAAWRYPTANGL